MPSHTPLQELVAHDLGISVPQLMRRIRAARAKNKPESWTQLAEQISRDAGRRVTFETVRTWYNTAYPPVALEEQRSAP